MLKVETQDLADRQVQLTVEVPGDRVQLAMRSAARRLSARKRIPGFRPGKAPYDMVVKRLGEEAVFEEALDGLGSEIYRSALEDTDLQPYAPGTLEEVVSREPLVLRYTVPLAPEVELGPYRELRLPFEEPQVTDQAVEHFLESLRQTKATSESVERPAEHGDIVVLDVRAELQPPPEGEQAVLMDDRSVSVLVDPDTDWPIPSAAAHLLGLSAGEVREFDFAFPADYPNEALRGRTARFRLTAHQVRSRSMPEWSDELARQVAEVESLADLREAARQALQRQLARNALGEYAQRVVEQVVEASTVTYPPVLLEHEIDDMIQELERRLREQRLGLQDYLKIEGKTLEQLREEIGPRARERVKRALVLGKVMEAESLDVSDDEIRQEVEEMVSPMEKHGPAMRKLLEHPVGRRQIAMDLLTNKAIRRLVDIARGQMEESPSPAEPAEETQVKPASEES